MFEIFLKKSVCFFLIPSIANLLLGCKSKIKPFQAKNKQTKARSSYQGKSQTRSTPALLCLLPEPEARFRNEDHIKEKKCDRRDSFNDKCQNINLDSLEKNKTKCMAPKAEKSKG